MKTLTDPQTALSIAYIVQRGKLPAWAPDAGLALYVLRHGSSEDDEGIAEAARTLKAVLDMKGVVPPGMQFNLVRTVAAIAGWDEARARLAIEVAEQMGWLKSGTAKAASGAPS